MNSANINQAMVNRANTQYEIKSINNRINNIVNHVNGIDVVFRELTSGAELINELVSNATGGDVTDIITGTPLPTLYESPAPSSYIKNLRPSGQWESFFTSNAINYHNYSPMMTFMDMGINGLSFNVTSQNVGGNIMNMFPMLKTDITTTQLSAIQSAILSGGEESPVSLNGLYYAQVNNTIHDSFISNAAIDHFTLHFE